MTFCQTEKQKLCTDTYMHRQDVDRKGFKGERKKKKKGDDKYL